MPAQPTEIDTPKTPQLDPISDDHASAVPYAEYLRTLGTTDRTRLSTVLNGRSLCQLKSATLLKVLAQPKQGDKVWSKTAIIRDYWALGTGGGAQKFGRTLWDVLQIGALKE